MTDQEIAVRDLKVITETMAKVTKGYNDVMVGLIQAAEQATDHLQWFGKVTENILPKIEPATIDMTGGENTEDGGVCCGEFVKDGEHCSTCGDKQ